MTADGDVGYAPSSPSKQRRFPGWRVVAGCFLVLLINSGFAFYGLAVYLNAFSKEQGWALGSISFAVTIFFVISGLMGLWVARLIARYDVRAVLIAGGDLVGEFRRPLSSVGEIAFVVDIDRRGAYGLLHESEGQGGRNARGSGRLGFGLVDLFAEHR